MSQAEDSGLDESPASPASVSSVLSATGSLSRFSCPPVPDDGNFLPRVRQLQPFDDISHLAKLTCDIHEACDLQCDPSQPPLAKAVDVSGELRYTLSIPFPLLEGQDFEPGRAEPYQIGESLNKFQYECLKTSRSIRLLKIKPAVYVADPLDCELVDISIDEVNRPSYDALSYNWGYYPGTAAIICNGNKHLITKSLEDSLRRYRRLGRGSDWQGKSEYIWADGICINQSDIGEKQVQVMMMEEIFSLAQTTFINLGQVPDSWIQGLHFMYSIESVIQFIPNMVDAETLHNTFNVPQFDHSAWVVFGYLFSEPWFRRTWVVQEMALSKNTPIIMYGHYAFTLDCLQRVQRFLMKQGFMESATGGDLKRIVGNLNLLKLITMRNSFQFYPSERVPCLGLIENLRDFDVMDPRDKIYGILSLMEPDHRGVVPDYSLTVEELYTKFAAHQIRQGNPTRLLDSAGLQRRGSGVKLPSWVPDWRGQRMTLRIISSIRNVPYSASGNHKPRFRLLDDRENIMAADAYIVDAIEIVTEKLARPSKMRTELKQVILEWQTLLNEHSKLCSERYESIMEAFILTLLMDDNYTGGNAINTCTAITNLLEAFQAFINIYCESTTGKWDSKGRMSLARTVGMQIDTTTTERRMCITSSGYIGLVPAITVPGDVVAVCAGATVPYILRPVGGEDSQRRYSFVGDCYVHGIMYGETLLGDLDSQFETILII